MPVADWHRCLIRLFLTGTLVVVLWLDFGAQAARRLDGVPYFRILAGFSALAAAGHVASV